MNTIVLLSTSISLVIPPVQTDSMTVGVEVAPLTGAEIDVAEEVIGEIDGPTVWCLSGKVVVSIAVRLDVLDADSVAAVNTHGE